MDDQANITLLALNANHDLSKRTIALRPGRNTIQVGRASKNASKPYLIAADNAWFDSPVMSREHAEISFQPTSKEIILRDVGSMHGTFVNNQQLKKKEPHTLRDGDIVVFGTEVRRGEETFPACAFRFACDFSSYENGVRSNTFTYPELSDIEDADDDDISDDGHDERDTHSTDSDIPVKRAPSTVTKLIDSIDLTGDDSPGVHNDTVEVQDSLQSHSEMAGRALHDSEHKRSVIMSLLSSDTDDDSENLTSDSDDDSDDQSDDIGLVERDTHSHAFSEEEDDEESDVEETEIEAQSFESASSSEQSTFHDSPPQPTWFPSGESVNLAKAGSSFDEAQEGLRAYGANNEEYDNDAYSNGIGFIRDAIESAQRARSADDLLEMTENELSLRTSFVLEGVQSAKFSSHDREKNLTILSTYQESLPVKASNPPSNSSDDSPGSCALAAVNPLTNIFTANLRQPSPSDAAMVKTAVPACSFYVDQSQHPSKAKEASTARTLADRAGKCEFFEARRHNKATLQAKQPDVSAIPASYVPQTSRKEDPSMEATEGQQAVSEYDLLSSIVSASTNSVNPFLTPLPFLHDPSQVPPQRNPSPELDMTSSVRYNESKFSKLATASKTATASTGRISIFDIIDDELNHTPNKTLKRKADDIADVIEDEVNNWSSLSSSKNPQGLTEASDPQAGKSQIVGKSSLATISAGSGQRPVKRARKFVERLGYMAVGGAAVGASVFFGLVATAPDFL